jgi:hypothetical protein
MATPCPQCDKGPFAFSDEPTLPTGETPATATARCKNCDHEHSFRYTLPKDARVPDRDDLYPEINPTDEPSRILDVGQWITLFRIVLESASRETDKVEARRLGYEAAQCLEEAIKFYDDNELPPPEAVFTDATRQRLRSHPQQFAKQQLLAMRAKLPAMPVIRRHVQADQSGLESPKRQWWKFWS